ncbi:hypothetical protein HZ326_20562 [Fusarium oxysporum f. sp. albedinis]|nr:hypothetical protein HZ326_20562 [Fusarium oxysporum f. sp. albedinis]
MVNASTDVATGYLCQYLNNTIFCRRPWLNINLSTPKTIRYLSLVEAPDSLTCLRIINPTRSNMQPLTSNSMHQLGQSLVNQAAVRRIDNIEQYADNETLIS